MSEEFDIFDANMNPAAPYRATRKEAHTQGLWHQTFHCWVLRRDENGMPFLFLQLRKAKPPFPSNFDISAAGHLQAGETAADGIREMEEELGIKIDFDKLLPLGIFKQATDQAEHGYFNREFAHSFFYETDQPPSACQPQETEVDGVFEISLEDGLALFSGTIDAATITGIAKKEGEAGYHATSRLLTREEMWGHHDRCVIGKYYLRVFLLAELYFKGVRTLFI